MSNKIPKRTARPGVDEYGRTKLHYAAMKEDGSVVLDLIRDHLDVNQKDDDGRTPLHFAAQERNASVTQLLLDNKADPNVTDAHGNSPLWTAIMNARGDFTIIKLLLAAGANPRHKNNHGRSPHDMAMTMKNGLEIVFS